MCKMNKCANVACDNLVVDNKYTYCRPCFKTYKADMAVADAEREAAEAARMQMRVLRSVLLTEYKSDKLRAGAVIVAEKEGAHVVISLNGSKHVFEDRGLVVARRYARERAVEHARVVAKVAEDDLKYELLSEFQAGKLRDGAKVTATNGPLVSIAFAGKSYTVCDREGAQRRADAARAKAEQERQAAAEKIRRAEEEKARKAAEIATVFAQIKADTLEDAIVDRSGKTINVLYDDGHVLSFDDPDVLAEEKARQDASVAASKAAQKALKKNKGKSEGKQDGKKGKEQRKAA